ncbi:MAG: MBL fold metallo-hydrolase [Methylophilus sp.]
MFKQWFDTESSTFTYLIVDELTKDAVIIDPVEHHLDSYIKSLSTLKVNLKYALETHVHADHITASGKLRQKLGIKTAVGQMCGADSADIQLSDRDIIEFGNEVINVIATPGHTAGSVSYLWRDRVFTGDALLINGCGRTDFQSGDAGVLYDSITQKIFTLPDETLVYPGHDYQGRYVSCVAQEKNINSRLANKTREEFIVIMQALNLPKPKMIDLAVPANRKCGIDEDDVLQG